MDDVRCKMYDVGCKMWDGKKKGGLTMVKSPLCYDEVSFTSSS